VLLSSKAKKANQPINNTMVMTSASFHRLAEETILHRVSNRGKHTSLRRFTACFGCSPRIVAHLWKRIVSKDLAPKGTRPQHLLWSLLFLKNYNTEDFLAPICGTDAKTYRKWIWSCIDVLNDLDLIKWDNRYMKDKGCICLVTCDGTDFKIDEPSPFSSKWYSQKFRHAGLRYEVCICIQTGWIVWINGPYPPGFWPDLSISRDGLNQALDRGEKFLADGTYADSHGWSVTPTGHNTREQYMKAVLRARHETVNSKFKVFGAFRKSSKLKASAR
jgi:hypothetical protein